MKIVVCMKQVPDTKEVRIDPETKNIIREGVPSILNPYDASALEAALRLREEQGGSVICVSMGPPQACEILQEALDLGADRALLLSDRAVAGSDTLATGYALSCLIRPLEPDLILCGAEAIDGCTGQVGPILAENLDLPQLTYVRELSCDGKLLRAAREVKDSYELYECPLPALVCILKDDIADLRAGQSQEGGGLGECKISGKRPEILTAKDANMDEGRLGIQGSPTRVAGITSSGRGMSSFVSVDGTLPARERIRILMHGGMVPKKISFTRGSAGEVAGIILEDKTLAGQLEA